MKKNVLILLCVSGILAPLNQVLAQNLFIEVLDEVTYRPIQDARIEMESANARMVFFSNPFGNINESVPSGTYQIKISHGFYASKQVEATVRSGEFSTLRVLLSPGSGDITTDGKDKPNRQKTNRQALSLSTSSSRFFLDFGSSWGNLQGLQGTFGAKVLNRAFASVFLSYCQKDYSSSFFPSLEFRTVSFLSTGLGAWYELKFPINSASSVHVIPGISSGLEAVRNNGLFDHQSIEMVMNYFLRPELKGVISYKRYGLFVGVNYLQWVSSPMNQQRIGIYNNETGQSLKWDKDLFNGRGGFGLSGGFRFSF